MTALGTSTTPVPPPAHHRAARAPNKCMMAARAARSTRMAVSERMGGLLACAHAPIQLALRTPVQADGGTGELRKLATIGPATAAAPIGSGGGGRHNDAAASSLPPPRQAPRPCDGGNSGSARVASPAVRVLAAAASAAAAVASAAAAQPATSDHPRADPPAADAFLATEVSLQQSLALEDHTKLPWGEAAAAAAASLASASVSWECAQGSDLLLSLAGSGQCFVAHIEALHFFEEGSSMSMGSAADGGLLDCHSILDDTVTDDGEWGECAGGR